MARSSSFSRAYADSHECIPCLQRTAERIRIVHTILRFITMMWKNQKYLQRILFIQLTPEDRFSKDILIGISLKPICWYNARQGWGWGFILCNILMFYAFSCIWIGRYALVECLFVYYPFHDGPPVQRRLLSTGVEHKYGFYTNFDNND